MKRIHSLIALIAVLSAAHSESVQAQSFGVELHNTAMPAAGGMGGVSIARPQGPLSAINGNPASLAQFHGTDFTFGGTFIDPTLKFDQTASFPIVDPLVTPFSSQSSYPASLLGNIGITHELEMMGRPVTAGLGFISNAGAGSSFANVPQSNGAGSSLVVFELIAGAGTQLTDSLSAGASFQLGSALLDPPFIGIGRSTPAYAARGSLGIDYEASDDTTFGAYYQTKQRFTFEDAILLELPGGGFSPALDVDLGLPRNFGFGVANESLMDGNLLLAADILWKNWEDTDLFGSLYNDQWVVQLGSQLTRGRLKWRAGYVWAENPIRDIPPISIGGISPPGLTAAAQYVQAQLAVISQHRISAGVGIADIVPGVDLDLSTGGMLHDSQRLGSTNVGISSYWINFGLTWHFDCCRSSCGESCGVPAINHNI